MRINPPASVENLGGKGYQLWLLKEKYSVPDFFVVCFDSEFEIDSKNVQTDILNEFDLHVFQYVSVRSSATIEDSKVASFAGMFVSKLNVTKDNLIQAIRDVLMSTTNTRVIEYCKLNQLDYQEIKMKVVIQRMVNSRVSGVCITKPQKNSEMLLLEACLGLGETLVSGIITPDTYKVNRSTLTVESEIVGFQKIMISALEQDKPVSVPFFQRNAKKLQASEVLEITQNCLNIERQLGYDSVDVEWTYENNTLFILQARPFVGLN